MARTKQTARSSFNIGQPLMGCWYPFSNPTNPWRVRRSYLPLSSFRAHTVIKDVASRTILTQSFSNETNEDLKNMVYSFPIYGGVSIVSFTATVGDVQITGTVKDKAQARLEFKKAVRKGEFAALLEQLPQASDVFTIHIGNVPAGSSVIVELVYIGELNYDAEADGSRFMIPSFVAPRYGDNSDNILSSPLLSSVVQNAIQIIVDVQSPEGCPIHSIQSASHPIAVNIGRTSDMSAEAFMPNRGSATLSLNSHILDKDFIVMIKVANANVPKALLELHPTIPNQRALLVTLVPRFQLPPHPSEVVFIIDRSGSMDGKMDMVIQAMNIMLKSLRVGVKFNICSFGSRFSFIWPRSRPYNETTLEEALTYTDALAADFGGTEMMGPVKATLSQRYQDLTLNVIILTDGEIWSQDELFKTIRECRDRSRFFSLGIGHGASTSLVQGIATEGNGISQFVAEGESMDKKMVRLLKGALTPHLNSYSLDVKYKRDNEDYEIIESKDASKVAITLPVRERQAKLKTPMTFYNESLISEAGEDSRGGEKGDRFAHLPRLSAPSVLQAPSETPALYPFSRATVYLLLDPSTYELTPESVILRASSEDGPIELEVKVEDVGRGETIHQLAARKAVSELEKGHGWLSNATDKDSGVLLKIQYESAWDEIVEREAIRLGIEYQIANKWCSFVALEGEEEHEPVSFGGKPRVGPAPRRQLASKACRRSAPSNGKTVLPPRRQLASNACRRSAAPSNGKTVLRRRRIKSEDEPRVELARPEGLRRSKRLQGYETDEAKMHALIQLQKFNGSWEWGQLLLDITGADLSKAKTPIRKDSIVATALAIAFLRTRVAHEAGSWELVVDKAVCWLDGQKNVNSGTEIQDAGALLS